jgi:hypothetical protein
METETDDGPSFSDFTQEDKQLTFDSLYKDISSSVKDRID